MARVHRVEQGETFASIAQQYGFHDWRRIYEHPKNADLRKQRTSPDLLSPGDKVFVPDLDAKFESCGTDERHVFVLDKPKRKLVLRLLRSDRAPFAGCRYALTVGADEFQGTVPASGQISHRLQSSDQLGTLRIWPTADAQAAAEFTLDIGHLEGVDEPVGTQARLANLGHYHGPVDGSTGTDESRAALLEFGETYDEAPGDDVRIRARLEKEHGC